MQRFKISAAVDSAHCDVTSEDAPLIGKHSATGDPKRARPIVCVIRAASVHAYRKVYLQLARRETNSYAWVGTNDNFVPSIADDQRL